MKSAKEVIAAIPTYGLTYGGYGEVGHIGAQEAERLIEAIDRGGFMIVKKPYEQRDSDG